MALSSLVIMELPAAAQEALFDAHDAQAELSFLDEQVMMYLGNKGKSDNSALLAVPTGRVLPAVFAHQVHKGHAFSGFLPDAACLFVQPHETLGAFIAAHGHD